MLDFSSISSNSMTMTDDVVSESHREPFTNDFDDGSIGPGRISSMSVEDDGSSFVLSQSFGGSTLTELSSVFSMSEDDFDKMASRHARFLFDEIDSMLYEHENNGPPHLVKECHEWRTEFPHLRVLGHQVIDRQEEGFHLYPTMNSVSNGMEDVSRTLEPKDLLVHGKHFDLSMGVGSLGLSHPEGAAPLEEILEENGTIEEILAIDYKTSEDECQKLGPNKRSNGRPPVTPFNCVKDNIISSLFNHVLKEVVHGTKPLLERLLANVGEKGTPTEELPLGASTDDLEISLLSNRYSEKNSRSSSFGASVLSAVPEDTPLGGLLTIRSKTLLNRERTMGILDGIAESLHGQTAVVPSIRLNPVIFGNSHLSERRSSLNRIKLSPLENNRLQSLVPPGEVDHVMNTNLDGLRGHRFATLTSQPSSTPIPKLPPLQNQRAIMSANVPNTNINRSMQASRRGSQRAISAIHEKDVKIPFREKDKTSLTLDFRPNTSQTLYNTDKRNDTPQSVNRQSTSLVPLSIAHRPSTALSAKTVTPPNLVLSGSGITPRKTERLEQSGNEVNQIMGGQLDLSCRGSGPLEEIMQVATRWNPMYSQLSRGKIYKNLQGGSTPPSVHSRLLQLRQAQHKTSVS